jgi:long-chain acyl-CoA synthetase
MFSLGERLVLLPKPTPIINTIRAFRRFPVTVTTGVNTLFSALVNHPEFQRQPPRGLRVVIAGGMALHADVARRFTELTGFSIAEGFGMTEASPVTHCNPLHQANGQGTIGVPLPSTVARVVDEHLRDVPHGSPGELVVRGPQVMKGYWQSPEATAGVLRDGWLLTGDMARMSAAGIFEICERKKEMILVSGFNVFPREVEEVLMAHPKVLEAAVLGLPDPRTGESVKAFVVPRDVTLSVAELRDYCSKELAGYKRPRFYEFRDSLPKSVIGKILKRELRAEQEARVSAHPIE